MLVGAPVLWRLAKAWFPHPQDDLKEATPSLLVDALGGPMLASWPLAKLIWFLLVSAAVLVTFYKIGAWIAEW